MINFLLTAQPPASEPLSLDVNVLELMLFGFGLLVTIGVAITLFMVFSRDENVGNHNGPEGTDESQSGDWSS